METFEDKELIKLSNNISARYPVRTEFVTSAESFLAGKGAASSGKVLLTLLGNMHSAAAAVSRHNENAAFFLYGRADGLRTSERAEAGREAQKVNDIVHELATYLPGGNPRTLATDLLQHLKRERPLATPAAR